MKTLFILLMFTCTVLLSSSLFANTACKETSFQKADEVWAGHYYLNGVMETGSELLLLPEGKFKWYLAYGALDQYAEGTWWKNGNCIGLKPKPKYQKHLMIFPKHLEIQDKSLKVIWKNGEIRGYYQRGEK